MSSAQNPHHQEQDRPLRLGRSLGRMLVGNILETAALRNSAKPAIICTTTGRRLSFGDLDDRTNRLAQGLTQAGFRKGDVVAFLMTNRVEIAEVYFALARTGIIGLPLNYRLAPSELIELMVSMEATGLIYEGKFSAIAAQAAPRMRTLIQLDGERLDQALDYEAVLVAACREAPSVEIDEADPFYFNLTSGTTGLPKAYALTQYNNSSLGPMFQALDVSSRDVAMTVFPAFGRVGFAWILGAILHGIPNVLANFEPSEVGRLIEKERVTIINLVPTMGAMLLQAQAREPKDMSSLRAIVFAGSSLPPSIREDVGARLCPNIYEYYGMQETGALVVSNPDDRRRRPDAIGRAITFAEIRIVDDNGRFAGPNTLGEVIGRSPNTVTAYLDNPEKSAETFRNGWVHTGDLGMLDDEGYLTLKGRKKDMIVTGGQNVHAADVEATILKCTGVADCAVFGVPDDFWGERVMAIVIPQAGAAPTSSELEAFCRLHLAGFKIPKQFVVEATALPRTPTGKVQKFLLVERFVAPGTD